MILDIILMFMLVGLCIATLPLTFIAFIITLDWFNGFLRFRKEKSK